jgi:hypothetical protein
MDIETWWMIEELFYREVSDLKRVSAESTITTK